MAEKTNNTAPEPPSTVPVNLYREDGSLFQTIHLSPEFATRFINFAGRKYERVEDDAARNIKNAWRDVGESPETAMSGIRDDD